MKKINILFTGLFVIIVMSSCKKGEGDPKFTGLSRKALIVREWKMKSGSSTITNISKTSGCNSNFVLNGSTYLRTETPAGGEPTIYL